ncbi:hypothetical protein BDR22DRAFT_499321 [Usnea florida]
MRFLPIIMLSRLRMDVLCVSILLIPKLLPTASGYVAQSPNVLIAPASSSIVATTSNSSIIEPSSVQQDLGQEQPPVGFRVEYIWQVHGIEFERLRLFNAVFLEMAILAAQPWNSVVTFVRSPTLFGVVIGFIGDRTARAMRNKHAMWALEEIFEIFVRNRRYASGSVVVDIATTRLGVGSVQPARSIQAMSPQAEGPSNATGPLTDIVLGMNSSLSPNSQGNASATPASLPDPNKLLSDFIPFKLSNPENLKIEINYRPGGVAFEDTQIYNATLRLLIRTAEPADMDASIGPILSTYNDIENFTISLVSNPFAKSTVLSWVDCLRSLNALVSDMWTHGPEGTWAELDGTITDGTLEVGRLCIDRGDLTSWAPANVCTNVLTKGASVLRP